MHGNAAEFTRSAYLPYPYGQEGERKPTAGSRVVVRGGSWRDLPQRSSSSFRLSYLPWQRVYNVGFRVISEGSATLMAADK
jgi:formylglycine-generating enzyme required for sulfatase activity